MSGRPDGAPHDEVHPLLKSLSLHCPTRNRVSHGMVKTIAIVTPVLDDWVSFIGLVTEIADRFTGFDWAFHIFAVDDGSAVPFAMNGVTKAVPQPVNLIAR